jgi:dihydrofolate reductase
MKLTATMFLSVDGVYQGPGGPTEDTSGGFDRGGWLVPSFDEQTGQFIGEVFEQVDAFLLGRKTYEIFKSYWPKVTDETGTALNTLPKHVVSRTMQSSDWQPTDFVRDLPGDVERLKAQPGRELQVHGSGALVRSLLEHDLLDELRLLVFPVIVGAGRRLFPDAGPATGLALAESRATPSGVSILVYRPTGRATFGEVPPAQ